MSFKEIFRRNFEESTPENADYSDPHWESLKDVEFRGGLVEHPDRREPAEKPQEQATFRSVEKREAKRLIKQANISGDPYMYIDDEGQARVETLTPKFLEKNGLGPKYMVEIDGAKIGLSTVYNVGSHEAVNAYVETDEGVNLCSYYRSNSAGTWRYLPDYVGNRNNGESGLAWFGKGRSEESLTLPAEVQAGLEKVRRAPRPDLDKHDAALAFAGTAKRITTKTEYRVLLDSGNMQGNYYQEVSPNPVKSFGKLSYSKDSPDSLRLSIADSPDFSKKACESYTTSGNTFGEATVDHFKSHSNGLLYSFFRDQKGRAWIGGVEATVGKITSSGLRSEWVEAGDLATPLYEHAKMADQYGDMDDMKGTYISMWPNYLSKMTVIQNYLKSLEKNSNI